MVRQSKAMNDIRIKVAAVTLFAVLLTLGTAQFAAAQPPLHAATILPLKLG